MVGTYADETTSYGEVGEMRTASRPISSHRKHHSNPRLYRKERNRKSITTDDVSHLKSGYNPSYSTVDTVSSQPMPSMSNADVLITLFQTSPKWGSRINLVMKPIYAPPAPPSHSASPNKQRSSPTLPSDDDGDVIVKPDTDTSDPSSTDIASPWTILEDDDPAFPSLDTLLHRDQKAPMVALPDPSVQVQTVFLPSASVSFVVSHLFPNHTVLTHSSALGEYIFDLEQPVVSAWGQGARLVVETLPIPPPALPINPPPVTPVPRKFVVAVAPLVVAPLACSPYSSPCCSSSDEPALSPKSSRLCETPNDPLYPFDPHFPVYRFVLRSSMHMAGDSGGVGLSGSDPVSTSPFGMQPPPALADPDGFDCDEGAGSHVVFDLIEGEQFPRETADRVLSTLFPSLADAPAASSGASVAPRRTFSFSYEFVQRLVDLANRHYHATYPRLVHVSLEPTYLTRSAAHARDKQQHLNDSVLNSPATTTSRRSDSCSPQASSDPDRAGSPQQQPQDTAPQQQQVSPAMMRPRGTRPPSSPALRPNPFTVDPADEDDPDAPAEEEPGEDCLEEDEAAADLDAERDEIERERLVRDGGTDGAAALLRPSDAPDPSPIKGPFTISNAAYHAATRKRDAAEHGASPQRQGRSGLGFCADSPEDALCTCDACTGDWVCAPSNAASDRDGTASCIDREAAAGPAAAAAAAAAALKGKRWARGGDGVGIIGDLHGQVDGLITILERMRPHFCPRHFWRDEIERAPPANKQPRAHRLHPRRGGRRRASPASVVGEACLGHGTDAPTATSGVPIQQTPTPPPEATTPLSEFSLPAAEQRAPTAAVPDDNDDDVVRRLSPVPPGDDAKHVTTEPTSTLKPNEHVAAVTAATPDDGDDLSSVVELDEPNAPAPASIPGESDAPVYIGRPPNSPQTPGPAPPSSLLGSSPQSPSVPFDVARLPNAASLMSSPTGSTSSLSSTSEPQQLPLPPCWQSGDEADPTASSAPSTSAGMGTDTSRKVWNRSRRRRYARHIRRMRDQFAGPAAPVAAGIISPDVGLNGSVPPFVHLLASSATQTLPALVPFSSPVTVGPTSATGTPGKPVLPASVAPAPGVVTTEHIFSPTTPLLEHFQHALSCGSPASPSDAATAPAASSEPASLPARPLEIVVPTVAGTPATPSPRLIRAKRPFSATTLPQGLSAATSGDPLSSPTVAQPLQVRDGTTAFAMPVVTPVTPLDAGFAAARHGATAPRRHRRVRHHVHRDDIVIADDRSAPTIGPGVDKIVFLGDFVDRGPNSVEVVSLVLLLRLAFPHHVTLLRGNHESALSSDFCEELRRKFPQDPPASVRIQTEIKIVNRLYYRFLQLFDKLPIACVLGGLTDTDRSARVDQLLATLPPPPPPRHRSLQQPRQPVAPATRPLLKAVAMPSLPTTPAPMQLNAASTQSLTPIAEGAPTVSSPGDTEDADSDGPARPVSRLVRPTTMLALSASGGVMDTEGAPASIPEGSPTLAGHGPCWPSFVDLEASLNALTPTITRAPPQPAATPRASSPVPLTCRRSASPLPPTGDPTADPAAERAAASPSGCSGSVSASGSSSDRDDAQLVLHTPAATVPPRRSLAQTQLDFVGRIAFLCHGGACNQYDVSLHQIKRLPRTDIWIEGKSVLANFSPRYIRQNALLWADPGFMDRGTGRPMFCEATTRRFLRQNADMTLLIRAHQNLNPCVQMAHSGLCLTVFSSSVFQPASYVVLRKASQTMMPDPRLHLGRAAFASVATPCAKAPANTVGAVALSPGGGSAVPGLREDLCPAGATEPAQAAGATVATATATAIDHTDKRPRTLDALVAPSTAPATAAPADTSTLPSDAAISSAATSPQTCCSPALPSSSSSYALLSDVSSSGCLTTAVNSVLPTTPTCGGFDTAKLREIAEQCLVEHESGDFLLIDV